MAPEILKAPKLKVGQTIRIVAPASGTDPEGLAAGVAFLREMGYKVKLGECVRKLARVGFLSAPDEERANEINSMFKDPQVDAIVCARGGYGCMRILPLLDFDAIKDNPKIFLGYSDITALHIAIHQRTGLITFHGKSAELETRKEKEDRDISRENLRKAIELLEKGEPWGLIANPPGGPLIRTVSDGRARGRLIGGNLTLIISSLATKDEIDVRGRILFFEDVYESEYGIEHYLTHLRLAGKLDECSGIICGEFTEVPKPEEPTPSIEEILKERLATLKVPAIVGLCCGHGKHKVVLPEGARATLDATACELVVEESVVE